MTYGDVGCTWVDVHLFFPKYNCSLQYAKDKSEFGFMMMAYNYVNLNNYAQCRAVGSGMERNSVLTHLHEYRGVGSCS